MNVDVFLTWRQVHHHISLVGAEVIPCFYNLIPIWVSRHPVISASVTDAHMKQAIVDADDDGEFAIGDVTLECLALLKIVQSRVQRYLAPLGWNYPSPQGIR